MIQTRNQNRIKQDINNKPKQNKKQNKKNKTLIQTDTESQNNIIDIENKNHIVKQTNLINANKLIKPAIPNNPNPVKQKKSIQKQEIQWNSNDQVQQYQDQIIFYLKQQQKKYKINQNYPKFHKTLNPKIRNFLVKYIFKIIWKYKCKRTTLYLSVYILDYYLSKAQNINGNNQCIIAAQACIYISMKYEEIYPPALKDWTADAQQVKKILECQADIVKKLQFKFNLPSIVYFEQYFQKKFSSTSLYEQNKENSHIKQQQINLISDTCLFDVSLYQFEQYDIALSIRRMVYNLDIPFKHERIVLNIKWIIQRNKQYIDWLKENKYKELQNK